MEDSNSLAPGRLLGPYEIIERIGAGGMGEVWRAKDPRIGRDVAIKVLPEDVLQSEDRLERFEREARAAGALNHPNLLTIHDIGKHDGTPYIVMELLDGETLGERLGAGPDSGAASRISTRRVLDWALQIANGLAAAHDAGIVHRDLKPDNIFLTRDGRLKILDFGLAKLIPGFSGPDDETVARATDPGVVMGTVRYMSPEQVRGNQVDHRSDIFAFGLILYELVSGKRPFERETRAEVMAAILKADPPEIDSDNAPAGLVRIIDHCLEKAPEQRFQTARDLAFNLESVSGSSGTARMPASTWKPTRSLWKIVLASIIALVVGVLIGRGLRQREQVATPAVQPPATRTLTYSGQDFDAAFSPDGSMVAFVSQRDVTPRIWLKQLAGGGELMLTAGDDFSPRFSPDGGTILFSRVTRAGSSAIFRVPILGGEPRRIIENAQMADWSPDGESIAFTRVTTVDGRAISSLHVARADGSQEKEVLQTPGRLLSAPRWSPDGTRIAVGDATFGNFSEPPSVVSRDGSQRTVLPLGTGVGGVYSAVAWVDDDQIVAAVVPSGTNLVSGAGSTVQALTLSSGKVTSLFHVPAPVIVLDVDREGRVVFDSIPYRQNLREHDAATGSPIRWLTRGQAIDRQPVYSPDGSSIVFSSNMTGNLDLSTVSLADQGIRRLTDDSADDFDPAFLSDGSRVLWSSKRETGHYEIWSASSDGSSARRVTDDGSDAENPTATRDGEWIVYNSYATEKSGLWKIHPDGTGAERLVSGTTGLPEVSPDGKWVSYIDGDLQLSVVSIEGGDSRRFAELAPGTTVSNQMGRSRWSPDGSAIVFIDIAENGTPALFAQDFDPTNDTRTTRRVVIAHSGDGQLESFGISPDGTRIVASYIEPLSSVNISDPIPALARPR